MNAINIEFPPLIETVPHRPPMLLLDDIVSFEPQIKECVVSASINRAAPFWDKNQGKMRIHWLMELIAQCVAVNYYLQIMTAGGAPSRGYLVAIDSFQLENGNVEPSLGDVLVTSVMEAEVYPFGVFSGTVSRQGKLWAQATMKFLTDERGGSH